MRTLASLTLLALLALLPACDDGKQDTGDDPANGPQDADGDGSFTPDDCDDDDPAVYPGAEDEPYDGVDADCAGDPEDDLDDDGFGIEDDCDDTNDRVNPDADEKCDGIDNDCDGRIDPSTSRDAQPWYADEDGDGQGDPATEQEACEPPEGWVENPSDCDDTRADVYERAPEIACDGVDNDCRSGVNPDPMILVDGTTYTTFDVLNGLADGTEVTVCEGVYEGTVSIRSSITVRSVGGAANTILDAGGNGYAVLISDGSAVLEGFTVTGGTSAGVRITSRGDVALTGLAVEDNDGHGVDWEWGSGSSGAGDLTITNSTVSGHTASGIVVGMGQRLVLVGVEITDNEDPNHGGGVYLNSDAEVDADETTLVRNNHTDAGGFGGGVYLGDDASWSGGEISENSTPFYGGGVSCLQDCSLSDVDILFNETNQCGGGVWAGGDRISLTNVILDGNSADGSFLGGGGGIYLDGAIATMTGGSVTNSQGNGAYLSSGGSLTSNGVDWGTDRDDNDPADVDVGTRSYDGYGADASFTCTADDGCR